MTTCCNDHDCCYGICGQDKAACDREFYDCMLAKCESAYGGGGASAGLLECQAEAWALYQIVDRAGTNSYQETQVQVCACCDCPPCQANCDGTCTDVTSDPLNCGACGNRCPASQSCISGVCLANLPAGTCTVPGSPCLTTINTTGICLCFATPDGQECACSY